jgi:hypothetical protein
MYMTHKLQFLPSNTQKVSTLQRPKFNGLNWEITAVYAERYTTLPMKAI